jgi:hypothetical protein
MPNQWERAPAAMVFGRIDQQISDRYQIQKHEMRTLPNDQLAAIMVYLAACRQVQCHRLLDGRPIPWEIARYGCRPTML